MAQTQLPGTQVKDSSLKDVDIASDAAIDISKLALPTTLPDKATPVDADVFTGSDSAASNVWKKFTWANIKATLKTYFDAIYAVKATGLIRTSHFTTTANTYTDVTGMSFTAEANKKYLVRGLLALAVTGGGTESAIIAIPSGYISGNFQDAAGNQVNDYRNSSMTAITQPSSSTVGFLFTYLIEVGVTAGAIKVQIKTSDGTSTAYLATSSFMTIQEVV